MMIFTKQKWGKMMRNKDNHLEQLDAKLLKYIRRKGQVSRDSIMKKGLGEHRFNELRSKDYIRDIEHSKKIIPNRSPPPPVIAETIWLHGLSEDGNLALDNYEVKVRKEWRRFWIPVIISLAAIVISIAALIVSIVSILCG